MVCPVATAGGSTAKRAARARASRLGPGATLAAAALDAGTDAGRSSHDDVGLPVRAGAQPVVYVKGSDHTAGGASEEQERERVGTARDRTGQRRARGREGAPGHKAGHQRAEGVGWV